MGIALLLVVAKPMFQLRYSGSIPETGLAFSPGGAEHVQPWSDDRWGGKNGQAATALAYIIYFPMLFLSGATMPLYIMPDSLVAVSKVLPLTYGVELLSGVWLGGRLPQLQAGVGGVGGSSPCLHRSCRALFQMGVAWRK